MALKNTQTNEYVKIIDVSIEQKRVKYFLFANLEQRQRFESGLSKFENFFDNAVFETNNELEIILSQNADSSKSIKDNLLIAGYNFLKATQFNEWIDA